VFLSTAEIVASMFSIFILTHNEERLLAAQHLTFVYAIAHQRQEAN
jgi:hypothetical protein